LEALAQPEEHPGLDTSGGETRQQPLANGITPAGAKRLLNPTSARLVIAATYPITTLFPRKLCRNGDRTPREWKPRTKVTDQHPFLASTTKQGVCVKAAVLLVSIWNNTTTVSSLGAQLDLISPGARWAEKAHTWQPRLFPSRDIKMG
jgi:hypothetical protein